MDIPISEFKRKDLVASEEVRSKQILEKMFYVSGGSCFKTFERNPIGSVIVKQAIHLNLKRFSSSAVESMKIFSNCLMF